jgi:hypothetical protein
MATQMVKPLSAGESRLLNWNRRGIPSALSFADGDRVRYFNSARPRKATDIVEGKRRNAKQNGKRPARAGLFSYPGTEDGRMRTCNVRRCKAGLS